MNKGKDFWAPRKHGFDDDGPMAYAPRQRTTRPSGRSDGFGDDSVAARRPFAGASRRSMRP